MFFFLLPGFLTILGFAISLFGLFAAGINGGMGVIEACAFTLAANALVFMFFCAIKEFLFKKPYEYPRDIRDRLRWAKDTYLDIMSTHAILKGYKDHNLAEISPRTRKIYHHDGEQKISLGRIHSRAIKAAAQDHNLSFRQTLTLKKYILSEKRYTLPHLSLCQFTRYKSIIKYA